MFWCFSKTNSLKQTFTKLRDCWRYTVQVRRVPNGMYTRIYTEAYDSMASEADDIAKFTATVIAVAITIGVAITFLSIVLLVFFRMRENGGKRAVKEDNSYTRIDSDNLTEATSARSNYNQLADTRDIHTYVELN
ncbi:uncharacterized protein LOC127858009 [Dreissena polymorpha]|uniref:Uncharacterized protein n=1 Tax=Dreissena polymorpha TaxID=45954 RepID=A0A9D4BYB1_DREPO|nr:uncharacterized protein LOC127858009 [Dreissena polymorpha]KAH3713200.1 hypothetical protein DPMN_072986 [Dreissena polymorpha]